MLRDSGLFAFCREYRRVNSPSDRVGATCATVEEVNWITARAWGESGIRALLEGRMGEDRSYTTVQEDRNGKE